MANDGSKTIRNCHFKYRCHKEWDELSLTSNKKVRHCDVCDKSVYLCDNEDALTKAIINNRCVAIPANAVERHSFDHASPKLFYESPEDDGMLIGSLEPNYSKPKGS